MLLFSFRLRSKSFAFLSSSAAWDLFVTRSTKHIYYNFFGKFKEIYLSSFLIQIATLFIRDPKTNFYPFFSRLLCDMENKYDDEAVSKFTFINLMKSLSHWRIENLLSQYIERYLKDEERSDHLSNFNVNHFLFFFFFFQFSSKIFHLLIQMICF